MNLQETGTKISRPLPYQLYADGKFDDDKKSFVLFMQAQNKIFGEAAAGAPFIVYAPGDYVAPGSEAAEEKVYEPARSWHYAVKAGDALSDKWPLEFFKGDGYHLRVYGPNGFFREFQGNEKDPPVQIECGYQRSRILSNSLTGNVELKISNHSSKSYTITIMDNSYKSKPVTIRIPSHTEETVVVDTRKSVAWYDFSVLLKEAPEFNRRYAGRVETGREGISDPLMGNTIA